MFLAMIVGFFSKTQFFDKQNVSPFYFEFFEFYLFMFLFITSS